MKKVYSITGLDGELVAIASNMERAKEITKDYESNGSKAIINFFYLNKY